MSAVTQSSAAAEKPAALPEAKNSAPAPVPVTHQEPREGGSYTRNLTTGALERADRAARQPDQE